MTKAIFYVGSPLQMLCGIEAQHHFNLNDAIYIIVTEKDSRSRHQILKIAEKYNLRYKIMNNFYLRSSFLYSLLYMMYMFIFQIRPFSYKYVFLGDACEKQLTIYSLLSIGKRGSFIYLDDGTASIEYIRNGIPSSRMVNVIRNIIKRFTKFNDGIFYTTYYEFPEKKNEIIPNKFAYLQKSLRLQKDGSEAYIIGPAIDEFCGIMDISTSIFFETLARVFREIKLQDIEKIIYIPHRRDVNSEIDEFCKRNNVIFAPLDQPVEAYFLDADTSPRRIYGFSSSALYTLKMLYPSIEVISIWFKQINNNIINLDQLNECFENKGIKLVNYNDLLN